MSAERDQDPVVDLDPETRTDATPREPDREGDLEEFPGMERIDEAPFPQRAPGDGRPDGDESAPRDDDVTVDKDLLRGGSGEQAAPRHPETDDDLLRGGAGWSEPAEERQGMA